MVQNNENEIYLEPWFTEIYSIDIKLRKHEAKGLSPAENASNYANAIGAVLVQGEEANEYASRLLTTTEHNNSKPEGFQWILIVEDIATRWIEVFPLKEATAVNCGLTLLKEVFLRYGIPRRLISDNGPQFISVLMQQLTDFLGIQQTLTPVYHPEANPVERRNRDMKTQLAILAGTNHTTWADELPNIRYAMNTAKCQSTGYTPAYLMFGRELRTITEVTNDQRPILEHQNFIPQIKSTLVKLAETMLNAKEDTEKTQDHNKRYADKKRRPQPTLKVGDKVLITTHVLSKSSKNLTSKFMPKRDGPYVIIKQLGTSTFQVASPEDTTTPLGTYHVSSITKYKNQLSDDQPIQRLRKRGRPKKPVASSGRSLRQRGRL